MKNIFELAEMQLKKERKACYKLTDVLDKAVYIRHWLDIQSRNIKVAINRKGGL